MTREPLAPTGSNGPALLADHARAVYWGVFLLVVLRSWIMPLGSSFWLDETGTFWLIKGGPSEIVSRSIHWATQSPIYAWIAWGGTVLGGRNEVGLRLPSLVAMALATFLLYRLAARLVNREGAWPTVLVFVSLEGVAFAAVDARQYACALLTLIGATLLLVRWMDTDKFTFALGYAVLVALTIYLQTLFAVVFLGHALYVVYRLRTGAKVRWTAVSGVALLGGLLLAPDVHKFLSLKSHAAGLSGGHTPRPEELFEQLIPPLLTCGILFGALLSLGVARKLHVSFRRMNPDAAVLILSCWLLTILLLFGVSYLTPIKVFIRRYLVQATPGLALFFGWAISAFEPYNARALVVSMVALLALLNNTGKHIWPLHGGEDWRGAMAAVRSIVRDRDFPVVVASSFIEGADPANFPELTPTSYMLAPLSVYPVEGRIIPVPYRLDENSRQFIEQACAQSLEGSDRFVLVTTNDALANWFRDRFATLGFRITDLGRLGVNVFFFEKS